MGGNVKGLVGKLTAKQLGLYRIYYDAYIMPVIIARHANSNDRDSKVFRFAVG